MAPRFPRLLLAAATGYLLGTAPSADIASRLARVAKHTEKKPLALLCFEDLQRGQLCHRAIFLAWWREQTGREVHELTNDGEVFKLEQLHHQVMPLRPR